MQIIYVIDPSTQATARCVINCEAYRPLFIDFLVESGLDAAIVDEPVMPVRGTEEQATVNRLMEAFHRQLSARVLN